MDSRRKLVSGAVIFAMAAMTVAATAQPKDPSMGTWVLNVAKSTYNPGPASKSGTRTYTPAPNGYMFSSDGVGATGTKSHVEFTAAFDGKYHVMTGSTTADSIMVNRVDANTVKSTQKKGAKEVVRTTRTVSKDGKTLTSTTKGTGADGKPYTNVEVFDRK